MDEFSLIEEIVQQLGEHSQGRWVRLGPGDDACVVSSEPGAEWVGSIDTLLADVHFPVAAPPALIGYRALMVGLSDLAAMAARPRYVLVALTLPTAEVAFVRDLARGMAAAAEACDVYLCGGNLSRGALSITVSVHGDCPPGAAVLRAGAQPGETLYVSGELGGAAACVRNADYMVAPQLNVRDAGYKVAAQLNVPNADYTGAAQLNTLQRKYYQPHARFDLREQLRNHASAAIDISDGLLADVQHLASASAVELILHSTRIPLCADATLDDALYGGDDYEIAFTSSVPIAGAVAIGEVSDGLGVMLDGQSVQVEGFNHFR